MFTLTANSWDLCLTLNVKIMRKENKNEAD